MHALFAIEDLKVVPAVSLDAGSLFYLVRSGKLRALCMRAVLDEVPMFAKLLGEDPFALYELERTQHQAIPLARGPLQIRLGPRNTEEPDAEKPGTLIISEGAPAATVRLDGYGGSFQNFGMRMSDGSLMRDLPDQSFCLGNWQLVSRDESGAETVLVTVGVVD